MSDAFQTIGAFFRLNDNLFCRKVGRKLQTAMMVLPGCFFTGIFYFLNSLFIHGLLRDIKRKRHLVHYGIGNKTLAFGTKQHPLDLIDLELKVFVLLL